MKKYEKLNIVNIAKVCNTGVFLKVKVFIVVKKIQSPQNIHGAVQSYHHLRILWGVQSYVPVISHSFILWCLKCCIGIQYLHKCFNDQYPFIANL